jgi:ABC-2 type transport system permease protein
MGIIVYGSFVVLFFYLLFFAFVSVSMGIMLSSIFLDKVLALDIAFFYNSPAFVFSGFTFPAWALPIYDQFYAHLIPYTHFVIGFLQLYQMNIPLNFVLPNLLNLAIFLFVGLAGSYLALRYQINKLSLDPITEAV